MPSKTKFISYRITAQCAEEIKPLADALGLSVNAFAEKALMDKLVSIQTHEHGVSELYEEMRHFRADFAKMTEAVLTAVLMSSNSLDEARTKAETWVRQNLRH